MEEETCTNDDGCKTDAQENKESNEETAEKKDADRYRVISVDKVTVEKYVLEGNGSREVFLTKNECSRRLSVESEPGSPIRKRLTDENKQSSVNRCYSVSVPEDSSETKLTGELKSGTFVEEESKASNLKNQQNNSSRSVINERIKPIKFTKTFSVGSPAVDSDKCMKSLHTPKDISEAVSKVSDKSNTKKLSQPRKKLSSLSSAEVKVSPQVIVNVQRETDETNENLVQFETTNVSIKCKKEDDKSVIASDNNSYAAEKEITFKKDEGETNIENSDVSQERKKQDIDVQDLLEKSQSKIEDLQQNLGTQIQASTAQSYKEKLRGSSAFVSKIPTPTSSTSSEKGSSNIIFDKDFIEKHNFAKPLKIEERDLLQTDLDYASDSEKAPAVIEECLDKIIAKVKPKYSEKVSEIEKRWSGDFLRNRLNRNSSESSKSSYVEEFGSTSSHESIGEDNRSAFTSGYELRSLTEAKSATDEDKRRTSEDALGNSTVSTFDSDSCLEDKIRAVDEVIENITIDVLNPGDHQDASNVKVESNDEELAESDTPRNDLQEENTSNSEIPNFVVRRAEQEDSFESTFIFRGGSRKDGYASLIKEFTMEAGSSRLKKDEKQKKKLGFRRLLPGFFSPKDSRKEYSKKELKERKKHDEKHFAKYQQNGNYTRSPDTMNLNEDIKRNVKLDTSLNGSIIEERLDEIKRELFPEQGLVTSTPDHFLQADDRGLFFNRSKNSRCCTADSSLSSIAPDDRWIDQNISNSNGGPDVRRYEQQHKRDEQNQRRYGQLERKHSLQEPNHGNRNFFFVRNHGPSGRISAPPSERFLVRSRAIHPVDRPLPAIPHSKVDLSNYENYREDTHYLNQPGLYENGNRQHVDTSDLILTPVSAQVKITRQPVINQNQKALLVGRSPKYPSSGSSQKSVDYADSSCTPNSSQKSEFSPTSSKSGEYYLNSPRTSARGSPNDRGFGDSHADEIYEDEDPGSQSRMLERFVKDRIYDETPTSTSHLSDSHMEKYSSSPCQEKYSNSHGEKYYHISQHQKHSPTSQEQKYSPGSQQGKRSLDTHQGKHFTSSHTEKYSPKSYPEKYSPNSHKEKHSMVTKVNSADEEFIYNQKNASDCSRSSNEFIESTSVLNNNVQKPQVDCPETDGVFKRTTPNKSTTPACQPQNDENVKLLPPTSPLQNRTESSRGSRVSTPCRKSQPNDQILIASPKRETFSESRAQRSLKETERVRPESPVPTSSSADQLSGIASTDHKSRTLLGNQSLERRSGKPEATTTNACLHISRLDTYRTESTGRRVVPPVNCSTDSYPPVDIQRPEPIYGTRKQPCLPISECVERISGIGTADGNSQTNSVGRKQSSTNVPRTNERKASLPLTGFHTTNEISSTNCNERNLSPNKYASSPAREIHRSDPTYGSCRRVQEDGSPKSPEIRNDNRNQSPSANNYQPSREMYANEEKLAWVQGENMRISTPERFNAQNGKLCTTSLVESANKSLGQCPVPDHSPLQVQSGHIHYQKDSAVQKSNCPIPRSNSQLSNLPASKETLYSSQSSVQRDPIYEQQQDLQSKHPRSGNDPGRVQISSDSLYCQHLPLTNQGSSQCRSHSPTKKQTMQHLEAFYWQQKALEVQRKSSASPANLNQRQDITNIPVVREVIYWQHLKKLNEEQQRKIYEQNAFEENVHEQNTWRGTSKNSPPSFSQVTDHGPRITSSNRPIQQSPSNSQMHSNDGDRPYWGSQMQRSKVNPAGKPPLMHGQKGPNQPVLIVRPQQAIRQRHEMPSNKADAMDFSNPDALRSKSASPPFHRNDSERLSYGGPKKSVTHAVSGTVVSLRKPEVSAVCEGRLNEGERKQAPPPIFKRGSLVGGDSVEYGSTGPKRVSFSNQANVGENVTTGNWPTKRGTAPEPPTRRHRSEDSDTDSVFYHSDNRQPQHESLYSNSVQHDKNIEQDYDANKPLPPPPKECSWSSPHENISAAKNPTPEARWDADIDSRCSVNQTNYQKLPPGICESESGSEAAGEIQKILQPRQEEEWNPNGKGRQANDSGGSGRAEGEPGSNELSSSGRRGGGGGGGSGSGGGVLGVGGVGRTGGGGRSRDEPRRHTLGGDHQPSLHHQQFNASQQLHPLHPHHLPPPHGQYGTPPTRHTTMDLEMGTKSRQRKSPLPRGYPPPSTAMLFDDDPGIMSEVETSSTGFRRGGKQRSSLPVVRTPSKTLERPLGLVFLQYRNETKRALLPNEITSIDTVKALFVRSFPKQLTMEYLDSPHVKVYIHDSNKDMFYELEDLRSHLRDIRDRSVLRLFESTDGVTGMPGPLGIPGGGAGLPPHWEDQSYFSEPEFDSEYQHQHIHKSKTAKNSTSSGGGYYVGSSSTLPRGGPLLRAYSPAASSVVAGPNATPTQPKTLTTPGGGGVPPAKPLRSYQCVKSPPGSLGGSARFSRDSSVSLYSIPDRLHGESGYMSSPERGGGVGSGTGRYPPGPYSAGSSYEDPYYSQYSGTVTPVIDEEASDTELLEESYSLYGVKPPGRPPSGPPRSPFPPGAPPSLPPGGQSYDVTRIRVEHMERQLANLTGLVQKALTHAPHTSPSPRDYLQVPAGRDPYARSAGAGDEFDKHSSSSSASLPDKSVSFEKSVSFSDEPPDMNSPKQHSPQHAADTKPAKPAIKSSTLPRMSSQERDRHKPTPPPKPAALVAGQYVYRDLALTPEMYNQLRGLQKKAKDLRQEVRNLRRMSQAQAHTVRETIRDTFITIRAMLLSGIDATWMSGDAEKVRLSREEDLYKQEMIRLEKDLTELESTVEELRGNVINRKTRVNMSDVENMALILSKSSKTVADLKVRFPSLQEGMKGLLSSEMEKVVREEKFLKEEPERLESALRRCKKLTGTLVTLKRLASVQEQRLPNASSVDAEETPPITPTSAQHSKTVAPVPAERTVVGSASVLGGGPHAHEPSAAHQQRPENALDALLDELQTFSRPNSQLGHSSGTPSHLSDIGRSASREVAMQQPLVTTTSSGTRPPSMSDIGRKSSVDSSSGMLSSAVISLPGQGGTLRRLHSYPSSSDTDTSPPIARLQVSLQDQSGIPSLPSGLPGQKPPVPERNAELLQLASARRVPPPPPPRTSSRSPLASPTSPQLPPRNPCGVQSNNSTLRRPAVRGSIAGKECKPPMALPPDATAIMPTEPPISGAVPHNSSSSQSSAVLSTSNSSSCESVNSQEGLQSKRGRQEQLEQRHQELLRKQKALQEQYARLQQLQRNAAGLTTVPPTPPDLLKKTGSESNLLAKMGLGMSTASSGSLTSLSIKPPQPQEPSSEEEVSSKSGVADEQATAALAGTITNTVSTVTTSNQAPDSLTNATTDVLNNSNVSATSGITAISTSATTTTTSKIYETDIL